MGFLTKKKEQVASQRGQKPSGLVLSASGVKPAAKTTPIKLKGASVLEPPKTSQPIKRVPKTRVTPQKTSYEIQVPECLVPVPDGYTCISCNELPKLMWMKQNIIRAGICGFDYETNGDPDDDTVDPQDHAIVGFSVAFKPGQAVYIPVAHEAYGANWDAKWIVENFLKPILEHPDVLIIPHNCKFEHQVSLLYGINMFPKTLTNKIMDTMVMVKALALPECVNELGEVVVGLKPSTKALLADENGMVHNLIHIDDIKSFKETVGKLYWDEPIPGEYYKSGAKKGQQKTKKMSRSRLFSELPVDQKTIEYGASDADWALGIYYKLLPICISEGVLDVIYELDVPFMMALGEIELAGWAINPESLKAMEKTANEALSEIVPKLQEALLEVTAGYAETNNKGEVIVPAGVYGMGNFRGEPVALEIKTSKPFNWGSPQHQQWLFFRVLKVDTRNIARSKTTRLPSCGKDEIEKIIEAIPGDSSFVKLLKEKKKYDKILSTYVEGMLPFCREDTKKIHTNLNLVSTWRLSSKKPNLQNIPRADNDPLGIRAVFEAPVYNPNGDYSGLNVFTKPVSIITERKLSGYTFYIGSDYSQIELKVLAWFAQERRMMDILAHGGDLHSLVAKEVFKLDCAVEDVKKLHKPARYRSKKVNFGIVYGMTEYGLSADPLMGMNKAEAKTFIENYLNTYPGVRDYSKAMIAFARDNGYVETMFGHRRPIPEINHPNSFVRSKGENKAMNTPIQGSAADIIRLAMVNIQRERLTKAPYIKQVMQIHDEVQAECPVEYAIEGAKFIKEVMERPIEGFSEVMPIIAEPAVGKIWAHALDIQFDEHGVAYVKPKHEKKEATDVTFTEIEYALPLYKLAGIEVRG